jgi:rRNA maturation endonuclease Nob1
MGIRYCNICETRFVRKEVHGTPVCDECYDVLQNIDICGACGKVVNIKACVKHEGKPYHHSCYQDTKAVMVI